MKVLILALLTVLLRGGSAEFIAASNQRETPQGQVPEGRELKEDWCKENLEKLKQSYAEILKTKQQEVIDLNDSASENEVIKRANEAFARYMVFWINESRIQMDKEASSLREIEGQQAQLRVQLDALSDRTDRLFGDENRDLASSLFQEFARKREALRQEAELAGRLKELADKKRDLLQRQRLHKFLLEKETNKNQILSEVENFLSYVNPAEEIPKELFSSRSFLKDPHPQKATAPMTQQFQTGFSSPQRPGTSFVQPDKYFKDPSMIDSVLAPAHSQPTGSLNSLARQGTLESQMPVHLGEPARIGQLAVK